ncbi:MAG: hypothetical protein DME97_14315 [Verrucomicrobia bacterium]|nr:MAG: hypothetical protein DME97_14315 [Verrucomicrobiota bacterium]
MKIQTRATASFSLVEIAVALGITAFCLLAISGLLPVGEQTNRNATSQTAAINVLDAVIADMRATPNALTTSTQYHLTFGSSQTLYFDGVGRFAGSPTPTSRYQLNVTYPAGSGLTKAPTYITLKVTWPAQANPANASGSVEMFAAIDRH